MYLLVFTTNTPTQARSMHLITTTCLKSELLEEISNSSLRSLLGDFVLLQVPSLKCDSNYIRPLEGLSNLRKSGLLLLRSNLLLGERREIKLDVVSVGKRKTGHEPSGHEMLEVHNLSKHSHGGSLHHLLFRHLRIHLTRRSRHSTHDSIRELVLAVSSFVHLHNDSLLAGVFTSRHDYHFSRLKTLDHLPCNAKASILLTLTIRYSLEYISGPTEINKFP